MVSSPGGEMKTMHIFLAISVAIRGRVFVRPHHHRLLGHRYNSWYGLVEKVWRSDSVRQESYPFYPRGWYHCGVHGRNFSQPDQYAQPRQGNISR
jgi:hypothetical protein